MSEDPTGDGVLSSSSAPNFLRDSRSNVEVLRMGGSGVKPELGLFSCGLGSPKAGESALSAAMETVIL